MKSEAGPGVPEALPRTLRMVGERLGTSRIDRLWIFPPLVRGRRERGLLAVSCYPVPGPGDGASGAPGASGDDPEPSGPRRLFTAPYTAERTGAGLVLEHGVQEQGEAPSDRLGRIMDGVVRRSGEQLGEPREIPIEGDRAAFEALLAEYEATLPTTEGLGPRT